VIGPGRVAAAYERVLSGQPSGAGTRVAFCVESTVLSVLEEPAVLAAGLARTLCDHGWDAFLVAEPAWRDLGQDVDVIVACSARYSPADAPGGPVLLGWPTDLRPWIARADLAAYDGLLAPSRLAAERLARAHTGPVTVLFPAVDPSMYPQGDAVAVRQGTVGGTGGGGGGSDLFPALRRFGEVVAVACPSSLGQREFGVVPLRLLHAIGAGALPIATSRLGLSDLDLTGVEVAHDPAGTADALAAAKERPGEAAARAQRLRSGVWARHTWRHRLTAFAAAVEEAKQARQAVPATVGFFPNYPENPYQRMLYRSAVASGLRVVPLADPGASPVVRDDGKDLDRHVLHIQWTAPLLQVATGPFDAARRLEVFKESVARFRERGGRVLWTVHNVLPHEVRFRVAEVELCEFLAQAADRIHVLGEETLAAAAPVYRIPPEKVAVIPHASYLDVYPDFVGRDEARRRLGLLEGEVGILLFGVIRPYKGLDQLFEVFERALAADPRLRLLVAGQPSASAQVNEWRERCAAHPRIVSALRYIDPAEVQVWMRAADLVVLPYTSVLNSGALHLALTFGRPVIAPALGVVARHVDPSFATTFPPGDNDRMVSAIESAVRDLLTPEASAAARAAAEAYGPSDMSQDFLALVRELVG
jgi:glycosyltransferase involved in cell wall biosynthesis